MSLADEAKAAKALGKVVKGALDTNLLGSISPASKKAGLDKMKGFNVFAEVSLPKKNGKVKSVDLSRDQFANQLHKSADIIDNTNSTNKDTASKHIEILIDQLHPELFSRVRSPISRMNLDTDSGLARRAARVISQNPTLTPEDAGKILMKHYTKENIIGHFSKNYINHIINSPKENRNALHSLIDTLTSTKSIDSNLSTGKETVPKVGVKTLREIFDVYSSDIIHSKPRYNTDRRHNPMLSSWRGNVYYKASAIDKLVKIAKRKASVFTNPEDRNLFYELLNNELKNPNGNTMDDIIATTKALSM